MVKYDRVLPEIKTPSLRKKVAVFLSQYAEEIVDQLVDDYAIRLNADRYRPKQNDSVLHILWGFKRKGTIRPLISEEEILEMARESKKETYLK